VDLTWMILPSSLPTGLMMSACAAAAPPRSHRVLGGPGCLLEEPEGLVEIGDASDSLPAV